MRRKWLLCGILCGVVSLSVFGQNVGASNYDKQIKETEKQQKEWDYIRLLSAFLETIQDLL